MDAAELAAARQEARDSWRRGNPPFVLGFIDRFRAELERLGGQTPGLTVRTDLGICEYLMWDDDPQGSYAVGYGISSDPRLPESLWSSFLWLSYTTEDYPELVAQGRPLWFDPLTHPFDLGRFSDTSSWDPEMLAALTVAAAQVLRGRRNAWLAAGREDET